MVAFLPLFSAAPVHNVVNPPPLAVATHEKYEKISSIARVLGTGLATFSIGAHLLASPNLSLAASKNTSTNTSMNANTNMSTSTGSARQTTWNCVLNGCREELIRCLMDPSCAANSVCLETCDPKDMNCQVRCGDIFQNKIVADFNSCVVSRKKCIVQKPDDGEFPIPPDCAMDQKFNLKDFTTWYISSGLNPAFDLYDCQVHEFSVTEPNKLTAKLSWRISLPAGGFFIRDDVQHFSQSSDHPGHLENHGNAYLNFSDDWYVISSKFENEPDDYVFVYYNGTNDAWDGYGGAIVYTRTAALPESTIPQLRRAAAKVGLDFDKFKSTDNTCKPQTSLLAKIQKGLS